MKDWIRFDDLFRRAADPVDVLATAMEEWALAQSLVMIHGREAGLRRYVEAGGHVRQNRIGEPVIFAEVR